MTLERITPGERVTFSASEENTIRDFINALANIGAVGGASRGSEGIAFLQRFIAPHAIFELTTTYNGGTGYVVWDPDDGSAPTPPGLASVPDVPYSLDARRVWLNHGTNTYGQAALSPPNTIYFPLAEEPDDVGGYDHGDRCPAWYDEQSGRWWSLNKRGSLSSSSSGEEGPSSSGESSSSGEESSSGEVESSSSSGECDGYTGTIQFGDGELVRVGDYIQEGVFELRFENGILCEKTDLDDASVYLCCNGESSSSG
jgi:hypothetical protein